MKKVFLFVFATGLSLTVMSCSDDEELDPTTEACHALCEYQAEEATDCPDSVEESWAGDCKVLCLFAVAGLSEDCKAKSKASLECQVTLEWECLPGGEVPQPVDATPCATEMAAFQECFEAEQE